MLYDLTFLLSPAGRKRFFVLYAISKIFRRKFRRGVKKWGGGGGLEKQFFLISFHVYAISTLNKRPLGLTAPLFNNTLIMIHSPINTKWPWFDLSVPPKVKYHEVNLKNHIWFTMCLWKCVYDAPFKSCDLDSTLKVYPKSNVLR